MSEPLALQYQSIPYRSFVHDFTHPRSLGAVGRLYGLPTADPETARVLELATGRGQNILWIARTLPKSQCLAMDLVEGGFLQSQQKATEESLANLQFVAADLLDYDLRDQRFDYIIAHGFLAWTVPEVQQRIFEVCRDHLAENGIGMISYNTLPGCMTTDALRQLFLLEIGGLEEAASAEVQLQSVDRVLKFLESAVPGVENLPHTPLLTTRIEALRQKDPIVLLHDECGAVNDPLYLMQFSQWAAETGLAYIADTDLRLDWMQAWPKELRRAIVQFQMPRLKALQYADYLFNTSFRRSLVCRSEDAEHLNAMPVPRALDSLWVTSHLRVHGQAPLLRDDPIHYESVNQHPEASNQLVEISDPVIKQFVRVLRDGQSRPYAELKQQVFGHLNLEPSEDSGHQLMLFVLDSVCAGRMAVSLGPLPNPES